MPFLVGTGHWIFSLPYTACRLIIKGRIARVIRRVSEWTNANIGREDKALAVHSRLRRVSRNDNRHYPRDDRDKNASIVR